MTRTTADTVLLEPRLSAEQGRPTWWRRPLLDSGYNLTALLLALPAFVLMVVGLALGAALLITLLGVPVLALTAYVARGFAHAERTRIRSLVTADAPRPRYHRGREGDGWLRRAFAPLADPQSWLDILWCLISFVTSLVAFVITVVWWAAVAQGLTYWFWQRWLPDGDDQGLAELIGLGDGRLTESILMLAIGIVALLTLPAVMRVVALAQAGLGKLLLCSRAELQAEVAHLHGTRDAARAAEAGSLRRLERDIHDGPQQRLVRLTMDLGRARKQIDQDPDLARTTIEQALAHARETVDELRSLSRGIAPPILVDKGLAVALMELAERSAVPVDTRIGELGQVPPHAETAAYFLASEALTNVAKHSRASQATLTAERRGGQLVVEVHDNGVGGAATAKGHGLAGLDQRIRAADGTFTVDSPIGGPTRIRAEIACG